LDNAVEIEALKSSYMFAFGRGVEQRLQQRGNDNFPLFGNKV
jgi:hypothetical protein